ncbi:MULTISPECIES: hypothetical protein [unclassified Halomonas]|uniref:hypothetical protein n=1 Tax=unclassified Halomonas TaxID=2609666 RepID=UPI00209F3B57|nr:MULTISPECIES: hypothetical protein [unclassified Halomonas]MCP1312922.1 hypothetical protein [Halomonas sp. 707D7]MCP1328481.1 hypothetical protein [Halomonas sp. 707D4]
MPSRPDQPRLPSAVSRIERWLGWACFAILLLGLSNHLHAIELQDVKRDEHVATSHSDPRGYAYLPALPRIQHSEAKGDPAVLPYDPGHEALPATHYWPWVNRAGGHRGLAPDPGHGHPEAYRLARSRAPPSHPPS